MPAPRREVSPRGSLPPLVGRAEELSLISSLLKEAKKGAGQTLIVSGEGGIGKTRILTAAAEKAQKDGWNVVTGRAYAVETGIPYALFSDALLPLLRSLEPGALSVLTRGGLAELALSGQQPVDQFVAFGAGHGR